MWFKSNWINHPQNHQRWVLKPKVHYIIHQPQIHPKTSKNHKDISHSQIYPFNSSAAGGWPTASPASLPTLSPGLTEQASRTSGRGTSWRVRSWQGRPKMMPWGPTRRFMRWAKKWLGSWLIDDDRKLFGWLWLILGKQMKDNYWESKKNEPKSAPRESAKKWIWQEFLLRTERVSQK